MRSIGRPSQRRTDQVVTGGEYERDVCGGPPSTGIAPRTLVEANNKNFARIKN